MSTQLADWQRESESFRARLHALKQQNEPDGFTWYGYDSLHNLGLLETLLQEDLPRVLERNRTQPMLDIGAADGDMAFFLEAQGFDVDILDYAPTNWNHLRGAKQLKNLLDSQVRIHEVNLDSYFELPGTQYGLVLFLGILYHLKNPFYVLEVLAHRARELVLSTRVARVYKQNAATSMQAVPCAYLLAPDECNNDSTNYWIFTESGLRRLLERTGWSVEKFITVGDTVSSNPSDTDHDERAFVLAKSAIL
jgi:2-polyprenyl-3-methyl-5-hydroxy-6-metoxy-1,4-benzoquinol methylase